METKNCQNCKLDFKIEKDDFQFYEKIKVPAPTFCPECRLIRRMLWRNEHNLYKRSCVSKDGHKDLISNYPTDVPSPVYEQEYWWSDAWDAMEYGQDYDFDKTFFEQFRDLVNKVPVPHSTNLQNTNSNYCNFTFQCKNCYFTFASDLSEDSSFLHQSLKCKNCFDMEGCESMENCFYCFKSKGCYGSSYTFFSHNLIDCDLMWDSYNCTNCFGCVSLRNKSNCIFNKQYSKEEYKEKIKEYKDGSYETLKNNLQKFFEFRLKFPHKYADILQSENVSGNNIRGCKNAHNCFEIAENVEDCKFVEYAFGNTKDCYDLLAGGANLELANEIMSAGDNASNIYYSAMVWSSSNIYYSVFCHQSNNLFGCVGLRNKKYCIFNKQYEKEEYFEMVEKIKKQMDEMPYQDKNGILYKYGEFFPSELAPFAYNETVAGDYFPLSKNEVEVLGYKWRNKEKNNYSVTMNQSQIPDNISDIGDEILDEVIECGDKEKDHSPGAFKITETELALYRKLNLPIPRKSPIARFYEKLKFRNPYKLWHRVCMNEGCQNEFETSYAPERPEIIYCESCYNKEVI